MANAARLAQSGAGRLPQLGGDSTGASGEVASLSKAGCSVGERARERFKRRNAGLAKVIRQERDDRLDRHLLTAADNSGPPRVASAEEVEYVSGLLNTQMIEIITDPSARSWYKLFVHMDDDCSGKVNYHELEDMLRNELKLTASKFSDDQLQALWRALDEDGSGLISCGEFGKFMRKGMHVHATGEAGPARLLRAKQLAIAGYKNRRDLNLENHREAQEVELEARRGKAEKLHASLWGLKLDKDDEDDPLQTQHNRQPPRQKAVHRWRSPRAHIFLS